MLISVAIPSYNNSQFLTETIEYVIKDNRISEIIIVDDASNDEHFKTIQKIKETSSKIKIYKNLINLGVFHNKIKALSLCSNEWAILLDADNIIRKIYIDNLFKEKFNKNFIYTPDFAKTFPQVSSMLNYKFLANKIIDKKIAFQMKKNNHFKCFINTGNYLVPVKEFIKCMKNSYIKFENTMSCIDVFFANHIWLKNNKKIKVVKDMEYSHRLHSNSTYNVSTKLKENYWSNFFFKQLN